MSAASARAARPAICVAVPTASSRWSTPAVDHATAASATYAWPRRCAPRAPATAEADATMAAESSRRGTPATPLAAPQGPGGVSRHTPRFARSWVIAYHRTRVRSVREEAQNAWSNRSEWLGWFGLAASAICFAMLVALVASSALDVDASLSEAIGRADRRLHQEFVEQVTRLGGISALTPIAAAFAALFVRLGRRWEAAFVVSAFAGAACLGLIARIVFHRLHPRHGIAALSVSMPHGLRLALVVALAAALVALVAALSVLRHGGRVHVPFVAVALVLPLVAQAEVRDVVSRTPGDMLGLAFPSSHALDSGALALALAVVAWRTRWRRGAAIACILAALAIGLSRVVLHQHQPTDVVAGWIAAVFWVSGVWVVFPRALPQAADARRETPPARPEPS
jgi:membrane-associated phospholipid phosphatase